MSTSRTPLASETGSQSPSESKTDEFQPSQDAGEKDQRKRKRGEARESELGFEDLQKQYPLQQDTPSFVAIRRTRDEFTAFDFNTGLRRKGSSRGKALATLAASIISYEENDTSESLDKSPLIELAGTISKERAKDAKEAIKESRQADIEKGKEVKLISESDKEDDPE